MAGRWRRVWDDYVTKVFKYLDANGDGFLDRKEVQRMPSPKFCSAPAMAAALTMNELDTDGDGKVSRDELAAYFRRSGATPFQVGGGRANRNAERELEFALLLAAEEEAFIVQSGGTAGRRSVSPLRQRRPLQTAGHQRRRQALEGRIGSPPPRCCSSATATTTR